MKRATFDPIILNPFIVDFNPRPREEGDSYQNGKYSFAVISIHALVKRATFDPIILNPFIVDFNPRPREEGDNSR